MDDEEIRKHKEKWRSWNEQRQREEIRKKMNVQEGMENYAANLIQKISDPLGKNNDKQAKQLSKKMGNEIQSNICSICLDLMIPPEHQPVILFPCGHNICKDCLFERPPQGPIKKGLKLKLQKCSLCRQKIQSYALNQSLMALICTYTNNKQLLQKEQERINNLEQQEGSSENIEQLRIRCKILENQQKSLIRDSEKYENEKLILVQVIQTLKREKKQNQKELQKIQQEGKLIAKCLTDKVQQMEILQKKLREINDKEKILSKALQPLKQEKQKQQLLQFARIIQKK